MMESPGHTSSRTLPFAGLSGAAVVQPFDSRLRAVNDNDEPEPPPAAAAPIPRMESLLLVADRSRPGVGCVRVMLSAALAFVDESACPGFPVGSAWAADPDYLVRRAGARKPVQPTRA